MRLRRASVDHNHPVAEPGQRHRRQHDPPREPPRPGLRHPRMPLRRGSQPVPPSGDLPSAANERGAIESVRELKEQLEALRGESERAERDGELGKAAELRYGKIPALEKQLSRGTTSVLGPWRSGS